MGLTNLRTKFRDSKKHTWWGILLVLGLAIMLPVFFAGGGSGGRRNRDPEQDRRQAAIEASQKAVATVGSEKITRAALEDYTTAMAQGQTLNPLQRHMYAPNVLSALEDQMILVEAAKKQKIEVDSSEVNAEITKRVKDQATQAGVYQLASKDQQKQMEDQIRFSIEAQRDEIRNGLITKRLQDKLQKNVSLTTPGLKEEDIEINARHILIQWKGLKSADKKITRTQAEAKALATKLTADAQKNPSGFAVLAQQNSDEPGAKQRSGDLGWFGKAAMVKPFWAAAYAAKPPAVIGPVQTAFGYHVIKVEERRVSQARQFQEVQKLLDDEKKKTKPVVVALDILAAQANADFRKAGIGKDKKADAVKRASVITAYEAAAKARKDDPALKMMLGILYKEAGSTDKAIASFQEAAATTSDAEIHMNLAELYRKTNQKQKAIDEYQVAGRLAGSNISIHAMMQDAFKQMGEKELAKQQALWIQRAVKNQGQQPTRMPLGG